jgi:hypothetical protein
MVWQQHVHDGTGDEDDDRREDDWQPETGKERHREASWAKLKTTSQGGYS